MTDPDSLEAVISPQPPFSWGSVLLRLHYVYPAVIFTYYAATTLVAMCKLQTKSAADNTLIHKRLIISLLLFAVSTYIVQLINLAVQSLIFKSPPPSQDAIVGLLSCVLVYGVEFISLADSGKPVWYPYVGSFWIAIFMEPIITALDVLERTPLMLTSADWLNFTTVAARWLAFLTILVVYYSLLCGPSRERGTAVERQPLIPKKDGEHQAASPTATQDSGTDGYATITHDAANDSQDAESLESELERREREAEEQMEKRLAEEGNWFDYARRFMIFIPHIWPVNDKALQLRAALVGLCLLGDNLLGLLLPRQLGIVTDSLNKVNDKNPWVQVAVFAALKLVNSSGGLGYVRRRLWLPVDLYSYRTLTTASYTHVLSLSSDFHDEKSSSDIMTAMEAGGSISNMLETVCFSAVPMLIDMTIASVYLSVTFGPYEGFITVATAILFFQVTSRTLSALKNMRRKEVSAWFDQHYIPQAGIQGWSTVACFNQIDYENDRYTSTEMVDTWWESSIGYMTAWAFQSLTLLCGLLAGLFLAVYQITSGRATPGQFVMLLTYWGQLTGLLAFFSNLGKSLSRDFISAEKLLEIMQTKPTVIDKEGALPLNFKGGQVTFDGVAFSYDKKKDILKGVNLEVAPGATVAFVGPTGAGKSTMLKLIDRFYDVTEGSIKIDGQDIRDVELSSLRAQIGVVPQTPIMFDDTVMNNVRYARLYATDEEVFDACRAACIHDQILSFTQGYKTRVGERGVKLSGGELQRVAIARAILKRPAIVLLDEATSAVDTDTEQKIQDAFGTLCKGRTTFIVAHRLSTVINADRIIVIQDGGIAEQGSHDELLRAKGKYADLWAKQVFLKPKATKKSEAEDQPKAGNKAVAEDSSLTNDPLIEVAETELANATEPSTPTKQPDTSTETRAGDDKETAGHVREGSKLNPDAAEFTPRSVQPQRPPVVSSTSPTRRWGSEDLDEDDFSTASQHVHFAPMPIMYVPGVYPVFPEYPQLLEDDSVPAIVPFQMDQPLPDDQTMQPPPTVTPVQESVAAGLRYPRSSRRGQSKSEPSSSGTASEDS